MPVSKAPRKKVRTPESAKPKKAKVDLIADLNSLDQACRETLRPFSALSPLLTNKELVSNGDIEKISDVAKILANDVTNFVSELNQIKASIPASLRNTNMNHTMQAMEIGYKYNDWADRYGSAVPPLVDQLGNLLAEAESNMLAKKADANKES